MLEQVDASPLFPMMRKLSDTPSFPTDWIERLANQGYTTLLDFMSACQVDNGRAGLARLLGCLEDDILHVEQMLNNQYSINDDDLKPVNHPLGLRDEVKS